MNKKNIKHMSILARDKRQLTYIYSSSSQLGKKVLGYVHATKKHVEVIDIAKEKISQTVWVEIAEELDSSFEDIFDTHSISMAKKEDYDANDWLKLIENNPELLQKPIAINNKSSKLITSRSEILEFFGVDSAGLEKGFNHESPTTSSTTKNEKFI